MPPIPISAPHHLTPPGALKQAARIYLPEKQGKWKSAAKEPPACCPEEKGPEGGLLDSLVTHTSSAPLSCLLSNAQLVTWVSLLPLSSPP